MVKKSITLFILLLAVASVARGQICHTCSPQVQREKDTTAAREERAQDIADHNKWPERPHLSSFFNRPQYTPYKAVFAITNNTAKKIKQVTWECTFIDPTTKRTIASYTLVTNKRIAPQKDANLKETVIVPLTGLPDAEVHQAIQINEIKEVKFTDGSVVRP